jgi:hypothetical protein
MTAGHGPASVPSSEVRRPTAVRAPSIDARVGRLDTGPADGLPFGEPMLMWSFNRDGQCDPALEQHRNRAMGVDRAEKRASRSELVDQAHPHEGVTLLDRAFPGSTPLPGVVDRSEAG